MYSLNLNKDKRILSATLEKYNPQGVIVATLPEGDITDYLYQNGAYVFQPLEKEAVAPVQEPTLEERLQATEQALLALMGG